MLVYVYFFSLYNYIISFKREMELEELAAKRAEEAKIQSIIEEQKRALLAQHAQVLQQHNPKAMAYYK
jgi:hypothetical protein